MSYNVTRGDASDAVRRDKFQTFEDLDVYKAAREFRKAMYALTRRLPDSEKYDLASQIRRAALSLTNNIGEGHGRFHYPDQIRFILHSRGSLDELVYDLNICSDDKYLLADEVVKLKEQASGVLILINGYLRLPSKSFRFRLRVRRFRFSKHGSAQGFAFVTFLTFDVGLESLEQIKARIEAAVPRAKLSVVANPSPVNQPSLLLDNDHAFEVARFLHDDATLQLDYCSNCTGVDWLDRKVKKTVKVKKVVDGEEKEVDETQEELVPGYLEAVYHLYSIRHKHGPVVIRMRTANRSDDSRLPSLTPIWRSAEFQEREIFDLYGIQFEGHPDLRRILMWDEFVDHPMRKDYREPDDYEYEPTPHDDVLEKAKQHYSARPALDGAENVTASQ